MADSDPVHNEQAQEHKHDLHGSAPFDTDPVHRPAVTVAEKVEELTARVARLEAIHHDSPTS